jgi:HTH-type transcriptional regulator/antitoxin HipB
MGVLSMETFSEELALTLREHRKKSKLTQEQLALIAGVGKSSIFDLEHGKSSIQLDTLLKIIAVLNIKLEIKIPLGSKR